jgi:hypothetical protein
VKSGCVSPDLKKQGSISQRATAGVGASSYSRAGIRKSKTSRWRAVALILLNLFMIAHIIQWRVVGKTVSPIEPSETMYTLQKASSTRDSSFFLWQFWRR